MTKEENIEVSFKENEELKNKAENKSFSIEELYNSLVETAHYVDRLEHEITVLKQDFYSHEHSPRGVVVVPLRKEN
jgi:predicted RNase H-like nuclease (RuvC/YqgF family)